MATTWGNPSLSMVARAAFLRSLKNSACSSGLSCIICRRLVAIGLSLLSRDGQVHREEAPGLVEALLRRILGIAGVGAHGEAVAGALVERERADLAERPHPRLHPTHVRNRRLLVFRSVQDQRGDIDAFGEIVRLLPPLGAPPPRTANVAEHPHPHRPR